MANITEQLFTLNKMSKRSVAAYHKFALYAGVSDSALGVLYALLIKGECSQYELFTEWAMPKQTINTTVGALQKRGLVALSPAAGARNKKYLSLTAAGADFARGAVGVLLDAEREAFSELSPEERATYVRLNKKYNEALTKNLGDYLNGEGGANGDTV